MPGKPGAAAGENLEDPICSDASQPLDRGKRSVPTRETKLLISAVSVRSRLTSTLAHPFAKYFKKSPKLAEIHQKNLRGKPPKPRAPPFLQILDPPLQ